MDDRACHWSSRARFESLLHAGFLNGDVRVDFGRWFLVGVIHGRPDFPPRNRVSWLIDGIRSLEHSFVVFKAHDKIPANLQLIFHLSQQFQCLEQKRIIASAHNQHYNDFNRIPMHPVDQKKKHSYFLYPSFSYFQENERCIQAHPLASADRERERTEPREKNRSIIPSIICCWLSAGCWQSHTWKWLHKILEKWLQMSNVTHPPTRGPGHNIHLGKIKLSRRPSKSAQDTIKFFQWFSLLSRLPSLEHLHRNQGQYSTC